MYYKNDFMHHSTLITPFYSKKKREQSTKGLLLNPPQIPYINILIFFSPLIYKIHKSGAQSNFVNKKLLPFLAFKIY